MSYQSFEDLEVWQRGCRMAVDIFKAFTACNNFTMKDQIQRVGLSVPSNIAEGYERNSDKEFIRFLNISKGSCGELRTQLYISKKLNFLKKAEFERLLGESKEISAMLHGLCVAVAKRTPNKPKRSQAAKI